MRGLLVLPPPLTRDSGGGDGINNDRDGLSLEEDDGDDVLALAVLMVRGDDVEAVRCERDGASVEEFSSSWSV